MLRSRPGPSRRQVLDGGVRGLLALALLGPAATACGSEPPGPDPLEAQLEAARRDSDLASAAAAGATPVVARALTVVAEERARHATALIEELARAAGRPTPTETSPEASPTTTAAGPAPPPPVLRDVIEALRRSARSASELAPTLSGYRAGLMGSIAAACTACYTVGLPAPGKPG